MTAFADLTLAKLDATIASEVAQEYEVTGFPTMVLFTQDNKPENLEQLGPHNDVFIATYMANKLLGGHFVTRLSSSDDVNNFRRQSELSCILVAPPGSQLVQMFKEAADKLPVSYMTATADPRAVPPVDKACTAGESCLLVFHESVPSRNRAVAHTDLGNMDAVSMYSWMIQGDIPQELRQGPFLSSWMQQIILLGSSEDTDHESSTARQVFDYAAKGSSVFFSDEVLQTELAHKWIIEAADLDENLQLPTMVMLDIEKGKLNQVVIWNRSLVPAEDEDENAVVEQARTWAHDVTGLEPKLMDKKATISPSDLANNPHLKEAMNTEHGEEIVVYDAKLSKEEQLKAAGHDTKIPDGKDLIELTEADFESKDDYHTWMKNRKRDTEAKRLAEELHEKSSTAVKNKLKPFKMTTGRWGMDASAIENERTQHKYVAVVEMCLSIGDGQGAQKEDDGHSGLDKFMNHVGIWYVNELKGTDMVYTKGCGCACSHMSDRMCRFTSAAQTLLAVLCCTSADTE